MVDLAAILITAGVTAITTSVITEPIKAVVAAKMRRRQLQRIIMSELLSNLRGIIQFLDIVRQAPGLDDGQLRCLLRPLISTEHYDSAVKQDFLLYCQIDAYTWIDSFYSSIDRLKLSPIDSPNVFERFPAKFCQQLLTETLEHINQTASLRRAISPLTTGYLQTLIKPSLRTKMLQTWHELDEDVDDIRQRNENDAC